MGLFTWLWTKFGAKNERLSDDVRCLIDEAQKFGLPDRDVANAYSMFEDADFDCAFDIVVQQLYEFNIPVSSEYYNQLKVVAEKMSLPEQDFLFVKELIK